MRTAALAIALALVACKKDKDAPSSKKLDNPEALALPAKPVPAGPLVQPPFYTDYTVIVPDGTDPLLGVRAATEAAKARGLDVRSFEQGPSGGRGAVLGVDTPVGGGVSLGELEYIGAGLTTDDLAAIRGAKQAVRVGTFATDDAARTLRDGVALTRAAATATNGWIYDSSLMRVYSRTAFDEQVPDDVAMSAPDVIMVGFERGENGAFTMVTLGLARLGLPELSVRDVPGHVLDDVLRLVNAAAQTLIDRGGLAKDGELAIDLGAFELAPWPEIASSVRAAGGTGTLTWTATWRKEPTALDPAREIELSLRGSGPATERLFSAMSTTLGAQEENVARTDADDRELNAARDRARADLAKLQQTFAKGIPHGERLIVKAPFTTDDGGTEWMWVDVQTWTGPTMTGVLLNVPEQVAALQLGARVEVKVAELFDYLHTRADGTEAGGETNRILQERQNAQ